MAFWAQRSTSLATATSGTRRVASASAVALTFNILKMASAPRSSVRAATARNDPLSFAPSFMLVNIGFPFAMRPRGRPLPAGRGVEPAIPYRTQGARLPSHSHPPNSNRLYDTERPAAWPGCIGAPAVPLRPENPTPLSVYSRRPPAVRPTRPLTATPRCRCPPGAATRPGPLPQNCARQVAGR